MPFLPSSSKHSANGIKPELVNLGCRSLIVTVVLTLISIGNVFAAGTAKPAPGKLFLDYSARPHAQDLAAHEVSIVDLEAEVDLAPAHVLGRSVLAYISLIEAKPDTAFAKAAKEHQVPFLGGNEAWGTRVLDVTADGWSDAVIEMASKAASKGFDGLFLDTIDSLSRIAKSSPSKAGKAKETVAALIAKLHDTFPAAQIIVNRGFEFLPGLKDKINGVLVESVYQTADPEGRNARPVDAATTAILEANIRKAKDLGLNVYAVDYVDPQDAPLALATSGRLEQLGCIPFITTPNLNGLELAPLREMSRRILVVFGWDPKFADKPGTWPIDTLTAGTLQTFLEWQGYELDYLDVGKKPLPNPLPASYAGVILDQMIQLKPDQEETLATWLVELKQRQIPILFAGGVPFTLDDVKMRLCREFGFHGTLRSVPGGVSPTIRSMDAKSLNSEIKITPRKTLFLDLVAPADAHVFLSLNAQNHLGDEVQFDPIFLAPWGGMWLEPYITLSTSQDQRRFMADPFVFLERWLGRTPKFPVPDVTTADGRRLFFSHIDGDGFTSLSHFPGHPTCAEVVLDKVLKPHPLPVTVSVIEAEIRGQLRSIKPSDAGRFEATARAMFDLPNVQAASHSYSHPFQFDPNDPNPGHYSLAHAPLNATADAAYPKIDPVKEINGSVEYINSTLLPEHKRVELFLWPGNTRPGVRALELCRNLGIENMNGGDTIISRIYPGIAGIAPRHCPWDDELQVFAANQNEFMYADGFEGPSFGGFASVIDTFELTAAPRRMKPVNVYYHFYSATYVSSLRALEKILTWCQDHPLHPITAVQYTRMVRDARNARIYSVGSNEWQIATSGKQRTFRLPETSPVPDLAHCDGVTGWKTELGCHYIHTNGQPVITLKLADSAAPATPHLRLVESSADLEFSAFQAGSVAFTVGGWAAHEEAVFGGFKPNSEVTATINGKATTFHATADGFLNLKLAPGDSVTLTVPDPAYVAQP